MNDVTDPATPIDPASPVRPGPARSRAESLEAGTALCLSGGGYRAMVFHIGAIWRLHETGLLPTLKRISSVSGGSIAAGVLALKWSKLAGPPFDRASFEREFVTPLRTLAGTTIDWQSATLGLVWPGGASGRVTAAYDKYLFHGATLQDLPDNPRFVINATNVQSGALWRFMKPYMADYRVGRVDHPRISLAAAVTASSAFPPVLSPMKMTLDPDSVIQEQGNDLHREPYTRNVVLSDGGVYDNLGIETAWKRYKTILVSDGGAKMEPEEEPSTDWARHSYRVLNLIDNQVRALRKRQVIDSYKADAAHGNHRTGTYWGIRTNIADYQLTDALDAPHARTLEMAAIPTRMQSMDDRQQERLINWGYAVCDAALRKYFQPGLSPVRKFPYSGGVG